MVLWDIQKDSKNQNFGFLPLICIYCHSISYIFSNEHTLFSSFYCYVNNKSPSYFSWCLLPGLALVELNTHACPENASKFFLVCPGFSNLHAFFFSTAVVAEVLYLVKTASCYATHFHEDRMGHYACKKLPSSVWQLPWALLHRAMSALLKSRVCTLLISFLTQDFELMFHSH